MSFYVRQYFLMFYIKSLTLYIKTLAINIKRIQTLNTFHFLFSLPISYLKKHLLNCFLSILNISKAFVDVSLIASS